MDVDNSNTLQNSVFDWDGDDQERSAMEKVHGLNDFDNDDQTKFSTIDEVNGDDDWRVLASEHIPDGAEELPSQDTVNMPMGDAQTSTYGQLIGVSGRDVRSLRVTKKRTPRRKPYTSTSTNSSASTNNASTNTTTASNTVSSMPAALLEKFPILRFFQQPEAQEQPQKPKLVAKAESESSTLKQVEHVVKNMSFEQQQRLKSESEGSTQGIKNVKKPTVVTVKVSSYEDLIPKDVKITEAPRQQEVNQLKATEVEKQSELKVVETDKRPQQEGHQLTVADVERSPRQQQKEVNQLKLGEVEKKPQQQQKVVEVDKRPQQQLNELKVPEVERKPQQQQKEGNQLKASQQQIQDAEKQLQQLIQPRKISNKVLEIRKLKLKQKPQRVRVEEEEKQQNKKPKVMSFQKSRNIINKRINNEGDKTEPILDVDCSEVKVMQGKHIGVAAELRALREEIRPLISKEEEVPSILQARWTEMHCKQLKSKFDLHLTLAQHFLCHAPRQCNTRI